MEHFINIKHTFIIRYNKKLIYTYNALLDTMGKDTQMHLQPPLKEDTSIPLKKDTRDRLKSYGAKGTTWDKLLNNLMDSVEKRNIEYAYVLFKPSAVYDSCPGEAPPLRVDSIYMGYEELDKAKEDYNLHKFSGYKLELYSARIDKNIIKCENYLGGE